MGSGFVINFINFVYNVGKIINIIFQDSTLIQDRSILLYYKKKKTKMQK